jgi:ATP-dependent Clp protease ATP-binding subunit ClpA
MAVTARSLVFLSVLSLFSVAGAQNSDSAAFGEYSKEDIVEARYGSDEIAALTTKAREIPIILNQTIIGQELAVQVLSDKIAQYIEGFPNRTREPISLNLVGLPGIGKSAMIDALKTMGFNVVQVDVQNFMSANSGDFFNAISSRVRASVVAKKPIILAIEEIDKAPELDSGKPEVSSKIIGMINQILTEGKLRNDHGEMDMSNIMVVTTMNISPAEIEAFSGDILKTQKSFYEFTPDDFQQFDNWVRTQPSARYKILSKLFRSNTVSRLAPQTLILRPFTQQTYEHLTALYAQKAIDQNLKEKGLEKMIRFQVDESMIKFLIGETVYAPSGARETVSRVNSLIEQLVSYSAKIDGGHIENLMIPRTVVVHFNQDKKEADLRVTPFLYAAGKAIAQTSFVSPVAFNEATRLFNLPSDLVNKKPQFPPKVDPGITREHILAARFPEEKVKIPAIGPKINSVLIGQSEAVTMVEDDFARYIGRSGPAPKEPSSRALIGFPGIGKSELFNLTGAALDLPVARLNMQQFTSDDPLTISLFLGMLQTEVATARLKAKAHNGKYILLIEELDKIFEINPQDGKIISRPIMGIIKDLMNDGRAKMRSEQYGDLEVDVRDAFIGLTMNFSIDRFGFEADPRLTTIGDVLRVWKELKSTPADLKKMLGSMFLPETVSRIMSRMYIMKPLEKADYAQLVSKQIDKAAAIRLINKDGKNYHQISLSVSERYKNYLLSETVIPSEGARNTVVSSQNLLGMDLEYALSKLSVSAAYADKPFTLHLDYDPSKQTVISSAILSGATNSHPVAERQVVLQFPPLHMEGKIPENRMLTSAHEFAHAYIASILGLRIEHVVVVSPQAGIGGYVKYQANGQSAYVLMARLYSAVASRAFERIVMSENPHANSSVLDITAGASMDIKQATMTLFNMLHELGMDPNGHTIDTNGVISGSQYANFSALPRAEMDRLGRILRAMENKVVEDILSTHSKAWLVEKITKLAQAGAMDEKEFYELVGMTLPEKNEGFSIPNAKMQSFFKDSIKDASTSVLNTPQGPAQRSIVQNAQNYKDAFMKILNPTAAAKHSAGGEMRMCSQVLLSR